MIRKAIIILIGLVPLFSKGQQYNFQHYGVEDGLVQSQVDALFQDSKGYLWLGTHGGVSRFDGKHFTNWSHDNGLPDDYVVDIAESKQGEILIATRKGLVVLNQLDELKVINEKGMEKGRIWNMQAEGDRVWIASSAGLFYYQQGQVTKMKTPFKNHPNGCRGVAGGGEFPLYTCSGTTIYVLDNDKWDSIPGSPKSVIDLMVDHNGGLWVANWSMDHVWYYKDGVSKNYDAHIKSPVTHVYEDSKHRIWASSWDAGMFQIVGDQVKNYSVKEGLGSTSFWGTIEDDEGNLWFGSFGGGLFKYMEDPFSHYAEDEGLPSSVVNTVYTDSKNRMWVGTDNGMVMGELQPDKSIKWNAGPWEDRLAGKKIVCFYERSNGAIAIASYEADERFLMYENGRLISWRDKIDTAPFCFLESKDGVFYAGTDNGGYFRHADQSEEQVKISHGGNRIINLLEDNRGYIWMATYGKGLNIVTKDSTYVYNEGLLKDATVSKVIQGPDQNMWAATEDRGLLIMKLEQNMELKFLDSLNTKNGFLSNNTQGMRMDAQGRVWVGTNKGMVMIKLKNGKRTLKNYGKHEGFTRPQCTFDAFSFIGNEMFVGTASGITKMDFSVKEREPAITRLALTQMQLNFEPIQFSVLGAVDNYNIPSSINFNYDQNHLTFIFNAIHFTKPDKVIYRFKLEGLDNSWSPWSKDGKITYSSIPHGSYHFKVESKIEGQPTSYGKSIPLIISPPFWKTLWFYVLSIVLGVIVLYFVYRLRTAKLKQRQQELESQIKQATQEIVAQKNEVEKQRDVIKEAHQEITDSIAYAKRIQSAILPPAKLVKEYLNQNFILYKPKDVVAGDFYWLELVENKVLFAAADCTGHGVPGAMVSVVCNNGLNRAVREYGLTDPGKILDKTREIVIAEFEKSEEEVKDGMDIALCSIEGNTLQYAGAHNPLWIIRKGNIIETKANKQPIGQFDKLEPYTTHTFELNPGDTLYLFSDGYVDQFGGEKGKKFKARAFRELLLSIQDKSMDEQREIIDNTFEDWKGNLEQIDDVCVIGVRV